MKIFSSVAMQQTTCALRFAHIQPGQHNKLRGKCTVVLHGALLHRFRDCSPTPLGEYILDFDQVRHSDRIPNALAFQCTLHLRRIYDIISPRSFGSDVHFARAGASRMKSGGVRHSASILRQFLRSFAIVNRHYCFQSLCFRAHTT